jgi:phospholipid/cholesterol/gamma-HCH transport system substrate-binding protein
MTERQMQLRIGALVLVGIVLFIGFVLSVGKRSALFEERYSLWTSFSSTEGLAVGSPVRLAGVTVGNVTRISFGRDPRDRRIAITLTVEQRVQDRIREDSVASIGTIGLVGDKVLDLTVGSYDRPVLRPGAQLASVDPPDYFRLLQKGDRILDHVTRISASLDEFFTGGGQVEKRTLNDALRSLRTTLMEIEKGEGLAHDLIYGKEGSDLIGSFDRTAKTLERLVQAVEKERGLLHALIYTPQEETLGRLTRTMDRADALLKDLKEESLGRLNRTMDRADALLKDAKEGPGLLHTLIYDREGAELLTRLGRTGERLEELVRSVREGQGLVPSLLFDPERVKVLDDLQASAAGLRNLTGDLQGGAAGLRTLTQDLQTVVTRLRDGEGTLGALLEDPTVYEDLSALLRGANRSLLLRSLIRSTREDGAREKKDK